MGIYNNSSIFGIRIYNFNDDDLSNILFEEKYEEIMNHEQMREAYLFYTKLNNKNEIHFQYYSECSSTLNAYNKEIFLMWHHMSSNMFLEYFGQA